MNPIAVELKIKQFWGRTQLNVYLHGLSQAL